MSLVDRTNETIPLSQHFQLDWPGGSCPAQIVVDADGDSSYDPPQWVHIDWTDHAHDADSIKLTYQEAGQLHDRLGRILGFPEKLSHAEGDEVLPRAYVEAEREAGREFVLLATAEELRLIQKRRANQEAAQEAAQGPSDEPGYTRINEQEIHDAATAEETLGASLGLRSDPSFLATVGRFRTPERGSAGDEPAGQPEVGTDEGEVTP